MPDTPVTHTPTPDETVLPTAEPAEEVPAAAGGDALGDTAGTGTIIALGCVTGTIFIIILGLAYLLITQLLG